jgi:hypothetical protein
MPKFKGTDRTSYQRLKNAVDAVNAFPAAAVGTDPFNNAMQAAFDAADKFKHEVVDLREFELKPAANGRLAAKFEYLDGAEWKPFTLR